MSSLYFRGKLAYATAFSCAPSGLPPSLIITPSRGLLLPETLTTLADLREISAAPVKHTNPAYRLPLERDARLLADRLAADARVILLGSVATPKYIGPLLAIFGERLLFPADFAGRGNMSRGSLLLRCCRNRSELAYMSVSAVVGPARTPSAAPRKARGLAETVVPARRRQTHR